MKYIIVGGVAGGASFACRLRRLDEFAEIKIYEKRNLFPMQIVAYLITYLVLSKIKNH